jgi:hypothetical protein
MPDDLIYRIALTASRGLATTKPDMVAMFEMWQARSRQDYHKADTRFMADLSLAVDLLDQSE